MMKWREFNKAIRRRYLVRLLIQTNCVITDAARLAGINRTVLYKQIKMAGIDVQALAVAIKEGGEFENLRARVRQSLSRKVNAKIVVGNDDAAKAMKLFISPNKQKNNHVRT